MLLVCHPCRLGGRRLIEVCDRWRWDVYHPELWRSGVLWIGRVDAPLEADYGE
jgi:hypothetical protein